MGAVQQVVNLEYEDLRERFSEWEIGEAKLRLLRQYDRQGRTVLFESQAPVGEPHTRLEYTYLDNGNIRTDTYRKGEFVSYSVAYMQGERTVAYEEYSPADELTYHAEYTYDRQGHRTAMRGYGADGSLRYARNYTYDEDGRRLSDVSYNQDGSERYGTHWRYDSEGRLAREWKTSENGRPFQVTLYSFEPGTTLSGTTRDDMYMFAETHLPGSNDPATFSPSDSSSLTSSLEYWFFTDYREDGGHLPVNDVNPILDELTVWLYEFDEVGNIIRREEGTMETRFGERQFVPESINTFDITYYEAD